MYRIVHTGAKIQLGGLKNGFSMVKYQVSIESRVIRLEKKPINRHIETDTPNFVILARPKLLKVN